MLNNYLIAGVNRVTRRKYHGQVYNLEVEEDNSYVIHQSCVHNCSIRDPWMDEFIQRSAFRKFFRWVWMPTVDSIPLQEQWIAQAIEADACFSYTDWGADALRREGGSLINVKGSASPGADLETFTVLDKPALRRKFYIDEDDYIVGMIGRNQPRKLFPELIDGFKLFLEKAPSELAKRTYLYLHTSYPDKGWDIPRLVKNSGISHKIYLTYKCRDCNGVYPSFYSDAATYCTRCGGHRVSMPNANNGVGRETLALIYNLFDVFVQYANCEGFGIPMVEAGACGLPIMAVDYSAMYDVVRKLKGRPIKVKHLPIDPAIGTRRAIPDNEDLANALLTFFSQPEAIRKEKGFQARQAVEQYYDWDKTAQKWMSVIDELTPAKPWDSPIELHTPPAPPKEFPSHELFVKWALAEYAGRPDLVNSYLAMRLIRDLNWGCRINSSMWYQNEDAMLGNRMNLQNLTPDDVLEELRKMVEDHNLWEMKRENCKKAL